MAKKKDPGTTVKTMVEVTRKDPRPADAGGGWTYDLHMKIADVMGDFSGDGIKGSIYVPMGTMDTIVTIEGPHGPTQFRFSAKSMIENAAHFFKKDPPPT